MKITRMTISNFRSFGPQPVTVDMSDATCFVGTNGSGKSALLVAMCKMFGLSEAERAISRSDFHVPNEEEEEIVERELAIEVRVEFPELKDKEGTRSRAIPECFNQMIVEEVGSDPYCRIRLEAKWVATNISEGDIEQNTYWVTAPGDDIEDHKRRMSVQERSQIHAIYVPAARDPSKQLRSARGAALARLLRAVKWSSTIRSTLEESAQGILESFKEESAIQKVTKAIRENWSELQNLTAFENPTLRPLSPEFDSLVRNLEFVFNPVGARMEENVERLSEGLQSLFYLALVGMMFDVEESILEEANEDDLFASTGDEMEDEEEDEGDGEQEVGGISLDRLKPAALVVLGIEEPENHLAPHYLGRIMERLLRLASSKRGQVLLTSHSPAIMSRVDPSQVRYLRLNPAKETVVRKILLPSARDEAFKYVSEAVRAYPELYFSTLVVLGEGDSETVVLPRIASALGTPLDRNFVSFVPLGGRHVNHFWKLLADLEIPCVTLLDLDLERVGGGWGRIKYACKELLLVGVKRKELLSVTDKSGNERVLSDEELEGMHKWIVRSKEDIDQMKAWRDCLEDFDVFFSRPLDLDFSMLRRFPEAYQATVGGKKGPTIPTRGSKQYKDELEAVRRAVLNSDVGEPLGYSASDQELFFWYRYLFLNRGKPSTHFQALGKVSGERLASDAPGVIKRLVNKMNSKLEVHR